MCKFALDVESRERYCGDNCFQFVHDKTKKICKYAVKINPLYFEYIPVDYQICEICLEIVSNNGLALRFILIKKRSLQICLAAV